MRIVFLLDLFERPLDVADFLVGRHGVYGGGVQAVAADGGHLAVFKIDDVGGVFDDGRGVAGDDVLAFADADDQGRPVAGHHQAIGFVGVNDGDAVGAADLLEAGLHGLFEVALVAAGEQMR